MSNSRKTGLLLNSVPGFWAGWGPRWLAWLGCVFLLAVVVPAVADEADDQYFVVLGIIQKAEALDSTSQTGKALAKYQEALVALETFHKNYSYWNPNVIAYRTKYLEERIARDTQKLSAPAEGKPGSDSDNKSGEVSGVSVKLMEAGSEPRKKLRLHPKAGDKQTLVMTMKMGMGMKIGEVENPPMKLPGMNLTMDVTVSNVSPDGDIASEVVMTEAGIIEEPGVMPQVAEAMKNSVGNLKGLSGKGVTSDRGINKGTEINAPNGADPQLRQAMDEMKDSFSNLGTPLPEEAIGPGAKWEAQMPLKSQGINLNQTATYELVSLEEDTVKMRITIQQTAPKQKVQNPAMPAFKVDLLKMSGTGSGEMTLNLGHLMPLAGGITSHSDLLMGVGQGAQQQTMTMKIDLDLHLEAK